MQSFKIIESFEIDDGSLSALTPEKCFVLGVEWESFLRKLKSESSFVEIIHTENAQRLVRLVERHGRFVEHSAFALGWTRIVVGSLIAD
jgi:hypothetical protein